MKRNRMAQAASRFCTFLSVGYALFLAPALAEDHGIAMYGEPALEPGFSALPYAYPEAPKGGRIVFGEIGGFDSLNPWILKGRAPWAVRAHMYESLLGRNWDEPFTLYGLLAESVETDDARSYVEFTLRPEAAFSDGSPVTVEDVLWSFETLGTKGHPRYAGTWGKIASAEITGARSIRFTFNTEDRELPLIMGLRPILQKANFEGRAFEESSLDIPIASGPYVVANFEAGRFIELARNPDYWGKDIGFNAGQHNLDTIRYEFFADGDVVFEAFKAGEITSYREGDAARWATGYDFPRAQSGDVVRSEIAHARPSGMRGFVMNTRRPEFADWRVREAMIQAFNFEFINQTLNGGSEIRIASYFSNSVLGMKEGPAEGLVAELLAPYADGLLPGALEGYALPVAEGGERNRANLRRATALLAEAGWEVKDGQLVDASGTPFAFEILLEQGSGTEESVANLYATALKRLGVEARIALVDSAQYEERRKAYDYDMTAYRVSMSLSPGNEQWLYWGKTGVEEPGTRNYAGVSSEAAEAMVTRMLNATRQDEFRAAVQGLDRVLMSGRYVIPFWHSNISRLAHVKELHYPQALPMYGDWIGFQPDVWWYAE